MHNASCFSGVHVKIDRTSKWGNPFKMDSEKDRLTVIWKYVFYILENDRLLNDLETLRYKTLACWCTPSPCHGSVLIYLSERPEVIQRYRDGKITARRIASDIFNFNGWNIPEERKQSSLFNF
jgi:hypothetical protein